MQGERVEVWGVFERYDGGLLGREVFTARGAAEAAFNTGTFAVVEPVWLHTSKSDGLVVVSRTDLEAAAMDVDFRAEAYEEAGWQISAAATKALADRLRAVLEGDS